MFSNSTEWEIWNYHWCRTCKNDVNEDCPIILNLFLGEKDEHIVRTGPDLSDIICTSYDGELT